MKKQTRKYKELKDLSDKEREILERWLTANGCVTFDYKNDDILIHDGGLFAMEDRPKRKQNFELKFIKPNTTHKFPNGKPITGSEVIFIKKPGTYIQHNYIAYQWPSELDETIQWFMSLKRVLNKVGIETNRSLIWKKRLFKEVKKEKKKEKKEK